MRRKSVYLQVLLFVLLFHTFGCKQADRPYHELKKALTFYASFDNTMKADVALGDSILYVGPSWDLRMDYEPFSEDYNSYFSIHEGEGKHGDALWIDSRSEPVFFYRGKDNISYKPENWGGTISFWLRLNPEEDLYPGYSDPIQITPNAWNDAALFVDFTDKNPRNLRFAIFPNREVWDPNNRNWEDVPQKERPMLDIENPFFSNNKWTHIAFTFDHFNTGEGIGFVQGYLNGEKVGEQSSMKQIFTWDPSKVFIWLGYNYRGYFDELSIFNRQLSEEEIQHIYSLTGGIHEITATGNP